MWFLNFYHFCFAIWPWGTIDTLDLKNLLLRCAIGAMSAAMSEAMATAGDSVTTTVNFLLLHGLRGCGKRMVRRMQEMLRGVIFDVLSHFVTTKQWILITIRHHQRWGFFIQMTGPFFCTQHWDLSTSHANVLSPMILMQKPPSGCDSGQCQGGDM